MAAPTTEFSSGAGTITATGEDNGLLLPIPARSFPPKVILGVSGTFSTVVLAVRGRIRGLTQYYPISGKNRTTGAILSDSSAITLTDSTNASYEFDASGCDYVEVYAVSGTPTSLACEARVDPSGGLQPSPVILASAGAQTFASNVTLSSGADLLFSGTTGQSEIQLTDNLADALSIKIASGNDLIVLKSTDSAESIFLGGSSGQFLFNRTASPPVNSLTAGTITTAGAGTYSAANLVGGLILRDPNGAGRTDTTATAAQLVAAIPGVAVGDVFDIMIVNTADAAETIALAGGTGVTLVPATITIAQNEVFIGKVRFTNVTGSSEAVTIYGGNVAG